MPIDPAILDMAYRVRTSQLAFADVPEDKRKDVAAAMQRLSDAQLSQIAEARRFPRGAGFGTFESSRVR